MQFELPTVSSESLSHSVARKLLVGEISTLNLRYFGQLYDDAADVGFALRNPKTNNVTRWSLQNEMRDPVENELTGWVFVPAPETLRKNPELTSYELHVLND